MFAWLKFFIIILLFSGHKCLSFEYKIDIFLDNEAMYSISELLSEYSQSNNVRLYITIGSGNFDRNELLDKKDVFFVTSKELATLLSGSMDFDGYKIISIDKLFLVGHFQNKLIQDNYNNFYNLNLSNKLLEIAKYGYLSIGTSNTGYGSICMNILNELGVYQQIDDSLKRYTSGEMVLDSIMKTKGFGILSTQLMDNKNLVVVDNMLNLESSNLYLYAIYTKKALELVNFIASGF